MTDSFPTPDQVARAIIAACRETGGDPIAVAEGKGDSGFGGARPVGHARAYAAMALRATFKCGPVFVSRMVGSGSPQVYVTQFSQKIAQGKVRWWSNSAFERVRAAIQEDSVPEEASPPPRPEPAPARPAAPPPRPLTLGKRAILEDLARAVRNTAAMQTD